MNESTFNLLAFQASWRKPKISHLIGRLARIEVTAGLKQDKEEQEEKEYERKLEV